MADDEYQANWRGARRYQFDEETRRKKAALESRGASIHKMRRVKWGDPEQKLKVLVEDLQQGPNARTAVRQSLKWPETEDKIKVLDPELHRDDQQIAWLERMPAKLFWLLTSAAGATAFCAVALLAKQAISLR